MLSLAKVKSYAPQMRLRRLVLLSVLLFSSVQYTAWAESSVEHSTATSTQAEDLLLLQKVQQQQTDAAKAQQQSAAQSAASAASTTTKTATANTSQATTVANDDGLSAGESIVALPSINAAIIDQANVLSAAQKQVLNQQVEQIYRQGKAQIGIVIVPSTGQESIADFAMRLAEKGQYGSAKQDNGLLIAVSVNDRRVHIATGYGLEGVLPDIVAGQIIRNQITPAFQQGDYAAGLQQAVSEIDRILNLDPETAQKAAEELKQRQEDALKAEQATSKMINTALVIFLIGTFASMFIGRRISAATSAVTVFAAGMIYGTGFIMSIVIGLGLFFVIITPLAQLILQSVLSGGGRGGGGSGRGGGGFSGGGGRFGGGGASGSW